jgi:outer membrane protein OmpA-like peptidoglycan-associated protein
MYAQAVFEFLPPAQPSERESPGAPPVAPPSSRTREGPFVVLERFVFDSAVMPVAHTAIIARIARLIVASRVSGDPIQNIRLVGHADSSGDADYNLRLAKRRAESVEAQLRAAITALGPVPAGTLNIVTLSRGEARGIAPNTTADGRARNRRVTVFLPFTCNAFFAQYDLRFKPGDPAFGIPVHPNISNKTQRTDDVNAVANELSNRLDLRASEALLGRVPPSGPLPPGALRNSTLRLSAAQLAMFREYLADGRGGIDFTALLACFERFANGELRSPMPSDQTAGVGEPDGGFFFLFAEFAFLCIDSNIDVALWTQALRSFVATQEIFMHVYRPGAVSPPPAVGAAVPVCPLNAAGVPLARIDLIDYENPNFKPTGPSSTVGHGQSGAARKRTLATQYATANLVTLRQLARFNLQRAQCMS